jgi:hypothetical protein
LTTPPPTRFPTPAPTPPPTPKPTHLPTVYPTRDRLGKKGPSRSRRTFVYGAVVAAAVAVVGGIWMVVRCSRRGYENLKSNPVEQAGGFM